MNQNYNEYYNRIDLYHEFLGYLSNKDIDYVKTLKKLGLKDNYRIVGTPRQDVYNLLAWIDEYNNREMPECLQELFKEFMLERM